MRFFYTVIACLLLYCRIAQADPEMSVSGRVVDRQTGHTLSDVYIKQQGSLNTLFTDHQGRFIVTLQSDFPQMLVFYKDGYESIEYAFQVQSEEVLISLVPIQRYLPLAPPAHAPPILPHSVVFGSQFTAFYQLHHGNQGSQENQVAGWGINELGIRSTLHIFKPWLLKGSAFRNRIPVDVAGFSYHPAFYVNAFQITVGGGYSWMLLDHVELFLGGKFLFQNSSPDNKSNQNKEPVKYTGTPTDFEQNRGALGLNLMLGWAITDTISIIPELSVYPLTLVGIQDGLANPVHFLLAAEAALQIRIKVIPGVFLVGQYQKQLWSGASLFDQGDFFGVGLSLDPWKLSQLSRS